MKQERIRCGGHYCSVCKKCTHIPSSRKNFIPDYWHICEECEPDVVDITHTFENEGLVTKFKIKKIHIPSLIKILENFNKN